MLFRQQTTGVIAAGAGQVRVDIHPSWHHDHSFPVEPRGTLGQSLDDAAVLDADVSNLAIDTVGGVVYGPAGDSELSLGTHERLCRRPARTAPMSARRTSVAERCPASGARTGSGTSSARYAVPASW